MVTPVFVCGMECGAFGHLLSNGGTASFDTTTFHPGGLRSLRCNPTASTGYARIVHSVANQTRIIARFYVYFATLPSADTVIASAKDTTGAGSGPCIRFKQSDSKIYAAVDSTLGASGVAVTTGTWYRIDADFNIQSAANDFCDVQVDGVACGQATAAGAGAGDSISHLGIQDTCTADVYFDDLILSYTSADYPIGAGYVKSYIPNADGTHSISGANEVERTLTGTDITNSTTDAYQLIDERPLPTTAVDWINWKTNGGTDFVEWQYEDSAESVAPRAVEAIIVYHDASGAGTHNFQITLRESADATTKDIMPAATRNVGATISYGRAHFATDPGNNAWTTTHFNNLRSRLLVSDASPDVYIDAAMLEAEFASGGDGLLTLGTVAAVSSVTNMALSAPATVVLGSVAAVSAVTNLAVSTPAAIVPSTVAAVATVNNLAVSTSAAIVPSAVAAVSAATAAVISPSLLTLSAVDAISAVDNILLKANSIITPIAVAAVSAVNNLAVSAPQLIVPDAVAAVSVVNNLAVSAPVLIAPSVVAAQSSVDNIVITTAAAPAAIAPDPVDAVSVVSNLVVGAPQLIACQVDAQSSVANIDLVSVPYLTLSTVEAVSTVSNMVVTSAPAVAQDWFTLLRMAADGGHNG